MKQRENREENRREHTSGIEHAWGMPVETVAEQAETDVRTGLRQQEAEKRLSEYGKNTLERKKARSTLDILLSQFKSLIMLLLAAAAGLSFAFGQWVDGTAILVAVLVNVLIGFFTELKAVRSMEALQSMNRISARVRRGDEVREIPAEEIVPGDVVLLQPGAVVPADLRISRSTNLQLNESPLTGESVPVAKTSEALGENAVLADRKNMAYKGTSVSRGNGEGIAVATGMDTELGAISSMVQRSEGETDPLDRQLNRLSRKLVWVILVVAVLAAAAGFLSGKDLFLMVETAIVLVVAAVPEGLPVVATVALARGMYIMARRNALVSRLSAVQTLGSTTVIFTDKTGTLTENRMTVAEFAFAERSVSVRNSSEKDGRSAFFSDDRPLDPEKDELLRKALLIGLLCSNAEAGKSEDQEPAGDPMEVALLQAAADGEIAREDALEEYPEKREVPFDTDTKMMATFHLHGENLTVAVKGAPDAVLACCTEVFTGTGRTDLSEDERTEWKAQADTLAVKGLRLLALATKEAASTEEDPYEALSLVGLVGLYDPPRKEVKQPIAECRNAGIRVVMVTGDHGDTAKNIGNSVGLLEAGNDGLIEGDELEQPEKLSEEEKRRVMSATVFARVSPEQKLKLIELYRNEGEIVAMTGDGVNDAPALKTADIGIAMGQRGKDVAKEAAAIILKDDAFATIVAAIRHGRAIFNNIRKFVLYLLSGNIGEILIVGIASVAGAPLPLLPLQILYLNAINDVFPALALGMGKEGHDVMNRPPRDPGEPIMTKYHWAAVAGYGGLIGISVLGVFAAALLWLDFSRTEAVSVAFLSLALGRLWHVFNMRDRGSSLFRNQIVRNPFVWGAIGLSAVLIVSAAYIPVIAGVLQLSSPGVTGWALVAAGSLFPLLAGQIWLSFAPEEKWTRD